MSGAVFMEYMGFTSTTQGGEYALASPAHSHSRIHGQALAFHQPGFQAASHDLFKKLPGRRPPSRNGQSVLGESAVAGNLSLES